MWQPRSDCRTTTRSWYSVAFQPLFTWCCEAVALEPGSRLLDVAYGSGQPALAAAARVGASGRVTAVDISPEMLARAERRAREAGFDHVEFIEMDAEHLRFDDGSFDAVTCSCGLMFFPDAARAISEMVRVLKPGGRVALAVWDDPSKSPFLTVAGKSVGQFFPPAPPDPKAPGGFRFARPGELEAVLHAGGLSDVTIESRPMEIDCSSVSRADAFV